MGGAVATITASTIEELKSKVEEWYEDAAATGLEDARLPWDPESVRMTGEGYEFSVWAHS